MTCLTNEDFQPFPKMGKLVANANLSHTNLLGRLSGHEGTLVYSYVLTSLEMIDSNFVQRGSGPNFQGDLITLCTCKRRMRTSLDMRQGTWIAGFSQNLDGKGNALFYLMKISATFASQYELWKWLRPKVREAKSASLHRLGDVFEPETDPVHPDRLYSPASYKDPHKNHSHIGINRKSGKPEWYLDINYQGFGGRHHHLLVGKSNLSFIWSKPIIYYVPASNHFLTSHPRTKKWNTLHRFVENLISLRGDIVQ